MTDPAGTRYRMEPAGLGRTGLVRAGDGGAGWGPRGSRQPEAGSRSPRRTYQWTSDRSLTRLRGKPTAWQSRPAGPGQ